MAKIKTKETETPTIPNVTDQTNVTPPAQETVTPPTEGTEGTQPPAPPAPPKTPAEIEKELIQAWKQAEDVYAAARSKDETPFEEIDRLSMVAYKAKDAIKKHRAEVATQEAKAKLEQEIEEYLKIEDKYNAARDANLKGQNELNAVPIGERTKEQLDHANALNAEFNKVRDELRAQLKLAFGKQPKTIHIPSGMTGKQLAKVTGTDNGSESKQDMYIRLMDEGMTVEQIMAAYPESKNAEGGPNGTLRTARTVRKKRDENK